MKPPCTVAATASVIAPWPSERLRGAALAGLLCLAAVGCSPKEDAQEVTSPPGAAGEQGVAGTGAVTGSGAAGGQNDSGGQNAGGMGEAAGGVPTTTGGASEVPEAGAGGTPSAGGAAGTAGAGGAAVEPAHITSSENVGVLTEEQFKTLCDARGGLVEVMPHCGGFATAKGFSYDTGTMLLSEHTCAGANTCGGWNCVINE